MWGIELLGSSLFLVINIDWSVSPYAPILLFVPWISHLISHVGLFRLLCKLQLWCRLNRFRFRRWLSTVTITIMNLSRKPLLKPSLQSCSILFPPLQVILDSKTSQAELELFPRYLLFLRQQPATRSPQSNIWVNMGMTTMRMYTILPRGNVSLQQDQDKPSTKCFTAPTPLNPPRVDWSSSGCEWDV